MGVPVIYAIYHKSGFIRPVVAVVKSLASSLSIGTGGSIGREGLLFKLGRLWLSFRNMDQNA